MVNDDEDDDGVYGGASGFIFYLKLLSHLKLIAIGLYH